MGKRKKTGERKFFELLWEERKHRCGVCDKRLHWFNVTYFAHIIGKGAEPKLRLEKDNIEILCYDCHQTFDHATHKAKEDERFDFLFKKKELLKQKYNGAT